MVPFDYTDDAKQAVISSNLQKPDAKNTLQIKHMSLEELRNMPSMVSEINPWMQLPWSNLVQFCSVQVPLLTAADRNQICARVT